MNITKENILAKVTSYDILNHYLLPHHKEQKLLAARNISNPFLSEKQDTPSFNIFPTMGSGEWRYKDFATGDDGSCFDLVMKLNNLTFPEALNSIDTDMNLFLNDSTNNTATNQTNKPIIESVVSTQNLQKAFTITKREYTAADWSFWGKFKINKETLDKFNVVALDSYSAFNKEGKPYEIKAFGGRLMFAYDNGYWTKIYKPFDEKKYKFQYLGSKEADFIFGWKHLPIADDLVFITGGEKDVLCLVSQGFNAVSLNSETATIQDNIALELKDRFTNVVVLYDNDATGIKHSKILADKYKFSNMALPLIPNNGKDVSDYFAQNGIRDLFNAKLEEALRKPIIQAAEEEKVLYDAVEIMEMGDDETRYLMEPIFPQKGSAVIAGKPDTGKSQFARQLCIQVALGVNQFIGFEINPVHNKALYVATEDNKDNTKSALKKQFKGLGIEAKKNLRFIFADTLQQEEIVHNIQNALNEEPADLVVIDSFGDIFKGSDANNNMAMRNTVKIFDKIGKEHSCLILFVHHINKAAYRVAPGQEHIQGGSGLVQKVRLAIQLSEGEGGIRYFTVVKGNYCPKEYKLNSLILDFSEETLLFTNTGTTIPTADIGAQADFKPKEEKYNELEAIANSIFGDKLVATGSFVKQYCEITGKSIPTAKRAHANLIKFDLIEKFNGVYRLKNSIEVIEDETSEDDNNGIEF